MIHEAVVAWVQDRIPEGYKLIPLDGQGCYVARLVMTRAHWKATVWPKLKSGIRPSEEFQELVLHIGDFRPNVHISTWDYQVPGHLPVMKAIDLADPDALEQIEQTLRDLGVPIA